MFNIDEQQMDWLCERIPDPVPNPKGGRPSADKRQVLQGIFRVLDNGAKREDLPEEFGSKSSVHRWCKKWVGQGVFEKLMRDAEML